MADSLLRLLRASVDNNSFVANESNGSNGSTFSCLNLPLNDSYITNDTFWEANASGQAANYAISSIVSIYFVVAFAWNLFIIMTYILKFRLLKEPANIFLFNLAIVDFMVTITIMLYTVIILAASKFVFGNSDFARCTACDAFGFFFDVLIAVSNHTLVALSFDRFILLAKPLRYKAIVTTWKAVVVMVVIWVVSLLIGLPPLLGFGQYEFNGRLGACLPRFSGERNGFKNLSYLILAVADILICLLLLLLTNVWTYKIITKFLQRSLVRRRSFRDTPAGQTAEDDRFQKQQQQLLKVFSALFVAHLVSWSPFIIVILILSGLSADQVTKIPNVIFVLGWLAYLTHPVLLPIIETFFVKDLRYQVRKVNKEVRRSIVSVGSAIMRASQVAFASDALDKANREVDKTDGNVSLKSRIHNKPSELSFEESAFNASTATECVFVGTPTTERGRHDSTNSSVCDSPATAHHKNKLEKRITWSDQSYEEFEKSSTAKNGSLIRETVIEESEENASQNT